MHSARCWTRCARRPILSPANWYHVGLAVLAVVGVLMVAISVPLLRASREESAGGRVASWPQLVDESLAQADTQLRLEMIERLGIVNSEWSRDILQRARTEDPHPTVRSSAEAALAASTRS